MTNSTAALVACLVIATLLGLLIRALIRGRKHVEETAGFRASQYDPHVPLTISPEAVASYMNDHADTRPFARTHGTLYNLEPVDVNPWEMQRLLMVASAQPTPDRIGLSKSSLLYWALICEEFAELTEGMNAAFIRHRTDHMIYRADGAFSDASVEMMGVIGAMTMTQDHLLAVSKQMRHRIMGMAEFEITPTRAETKMILDGTTDVTVVNCGLAVTCGLQGAEAYRRVATSNLSKRNDHGVIDKTPDGKWIKGPNYVMPDLDDLIA